MSYINKTRFFALMLLLTLLFSLILSYAETTGSDIADSVVRLHIVANSNSVGDQELKIKVRDRILAETSQVFKDTTTAQDALSKARQHSELIKQIALDEIRQNGFDYDVSVSVGKSAFPTKTYGDIILPSGKYNAVKVKIGNGSGENWWCVLYPPLCFTSGVLSVSDDAKTNLKENLSPSSYELITKSPDSSIPVEIKFRIVEVFQELF